MKHHPNIIEPDDLVEDLVEAHPRLVGVLRDYGLVCIQCGEPVWGTLGALIQEKGLEAEEVVKEINKKLGLL